MHGLGSLSPSTPSFTLEQYQKLLALIGTPNSPLALPLHGKENPKANVESSSTVAMAGIYLTHSMFAAKIVNRRAYDSHTWVKDTGATDHIVCSMNLLTTITAIAQSMAELPNGKLLK